MLSAIYALTSILPVPNGYDHDVSLNCADSESAFRFVSKSLVHIESSMALLGIVVRGLLRLSYL